MKKLVLAAVLVLSTTAGADAMARGADAVGPPAPRDRVEHLRSWEAAVPESRRDPRHYVGMLVADAITTEVNFALRVRDLNPAIRAAPGPGGRVAYFALATYALGKIDARLGRVHHLLPVLLRAWVAGVERQVLEDNQTYQAGYSARR